MSKWEMVRLGDVCIIERGGSPRPIADYITEESGSINWIKIGDSEPDSMYINKTKEKIKPEGAKKSRCVKKGDFILSNSMSFGRPYILNIDGCIHDGWLLIRDKNNIFDKRFLYYSLGSPFVNMQFQKAAVGGVVNNLNSNVVRKTEVPVPPLEVQKQIADTLDKAQEIIDGHKKQLEELDNLIKAIFYDMFGDPIVNAQKWEEVLYKNIMVGKATNGYFEKNGNYCDAGNAKVIWVSDILNRLFCNIENVKAVNATNKDLEKYTVKYGDLLFCRSSLTKEGIGKASVVPRNVLKNVMFECHIIKTSVNLELIEPIFLQMLTTTDYFRNQIFSKSKTSTMTTISQEGIINNIIILPPLDLQSKFATIVTNIEEQKTIVKKSIEESRNLFNSLMNKYFE